MKFLFAICLIFVSKYLYAQQDLDKKACFKEQISKEPGFKGQQVSFKNPDAGDIEVDGVIIDKRAAKYYHPGSLMDVGQEKAKKINFIYLKSFQIQQPESLSEECMNYMNETFDTGIVNQLRKWDKSVTAEVKWNECVISINLMSWEEINQQFTTK